MSEAWRAATVTSFEQVPVGVANGLLRVVTDSTVAASAADSRPVLLADDGYTVSRFQPIPAPADVGGTLRAAYPVHPSVVNSATVFSLAFADGLVVALPSPTHGPTRLRGSTPTPPAPPPPPPIGDRSPVAAEPEPLPVLDFVLDAAEARAELDALRELAVLRARPVTPMAEIDAAIDADAEQRIADERMRAESAALELAAARDDVEDLRTIVAALEAELESAQRDSGARVAELEVWSGELERRLSDATTALADARAAAEPGDAEPAPVGAGALPAGDDELRAIADAAVDEAHHRAAQDLADPPS